MEDTERNTREDWQEEEIKLPTLTFNSEAERLEMTERTVKQRYKHVPVTELKLCSRDNHYFELYDGGRRQNGRVLVECRKCPIGKQLQVGLDMLEDGRITSSR